MATTPAPTTVLLCDDCGEPSQHTICDQCESWRDRRHDYEDDEPLTRFNLWREP